MLTVAGTRLPEAADLREMGAMRDTEHANPASVTSALGTVGEAMTRQVIVLDASTPADVAARRLEAAGVSGAPVVARGRVVGVITLRDLLAPLTGQGPVQVTGPWLRYEQRLAGQRVVELMTREPLVARADWPLVRAAEVMQAAGVNRLPVVDDDGQPVGILTRDDVVRAVARQAGRARAEGKPDRPLIPPD